MPNNNNNNKPSYRRTTSTVMQLEFSEVRLCGRHKELQQLKEALDRVVACEDEAEKRGCCEPILVQALKGTGKTLLLETFHEQILERGDAYVCMGAYSKDSSIDEKEEEEPELLPGLNQLLSKLLVESKKNKRIAWGPRLQDQLKPDEVNVLSARLPLFQQLLGTSHCQRKDYHYEERENLGVATVSSGLVRLMRTICKHKPVVWIQNHLHLASDEQLELLTCLLEDCSSNNAFPLLFVGALEPDATLLLPRLQQPPIQAEILPLCNLAVNDVRELLVSVLRRDAQDVDELAKLLIRRTSGRAQDLIDLLKRLESMSLPSSANPSSSSSKQSYPMDRRLLYFSTASFQWEWNLERIVTHTSLDEHLVPEVLSHLTHQRLSSSSLDRKLKHVLTLAAHVGPIQFRLEMLHQLIHSRHLRKLRISETITSIESLEKLLGRAVELNMLEQVGERNGAKTKFQFTHERIHAAARERSSRDETDNQRTHEAEPSFHLAMGRALLDLADDNDSPGSSSNGRKERNASMLLAVNHLNKGRSEMVSQMELYELAKYNLKAAKISISQSDSQPAAVYLEQGHGLLQTIDAWTKDLCYNVVLETANLRIRILYASGKISECDGVIDEVLTYCRTFYDSLRATRYKLRCLVRQDRGDEALILATSVIENLGFSFPSTRLAKVASLVKFTMKIKSMTPQKGSESDQERLACLFLQMEEVQEPNVLHAMEFYHAITEIGLHTADLLTQGCAMYCMLKTTLRHGLSPFSILALGGCAVYNAKVGCYNAADAFHKITLQLIQQKIPYNDAELDEATSDVILTVLPLLAVAVDHWKNNNSLSLAIQSKNLATRIGAVHHLSVSAFSYVTLYIQSGMSLDPLHSDIHHLREILSVWFTFFNHKIEPTTQFVLNLIGKSKDPLILSGEIMDEKESLARYQEANDKMAQQHFYVYKLFLAVFFNDMSLAQECANLLVPHKSLPPRPFTPFRLFCEGIVAFSLARNAPRSSYRSRGRKHLKELKKLVEKGCLNAYHFVMLLHAEDLSLQRNHSETLVQALYDRGISVAGRLGLTHVQALANELVGRYFLIRDDQYWATTYLARAFALYSAWGARAKTDQMKSEYARVLRDMKDLDDSEMRGSWLKTQEHFGDLPSMRSVTPSLSSETDPTTNDFILA